MARRTNKKHRQGQGQTVGETSEKILTKISLKWDVSGGGGGGERVVLTISKDSQSYFG